MKLLDRIALFVSGPKKSLSQVSDPLHGWGTKILEPFPGAWQRNLAPLTRGEIATYSTSFACLSRISSDIGKLPFQLMARDSTGLWKATTSAAYSPVLRTPNSFQTPTQFRSAWLLSELMHGNTYVLKRRDQRGVVVDLYVLDPNRVIPKVSPSGTVYYQLYSDPLNTLPSDYPTEQLLVPASEIIHDREATLFHPLIGVGPLAAAFLAATKNHRISVSASEFFGNKSSPGGLLTAPSGMTEDDAEEVKKYWNTNFTGQNAGRVAVIGADMKFVPLASSAESSQLVEQLRYSDEQICHAFGVPPYKVGIGSVPPNFKTDDMNLQYYTDALQSRIERMEELLGAGLGLGDGYAIELDLAPLLRMDALKQAEVASALVKSGISTPNEARRRFDLAPVAGGDSPYLQQQNFSLEALAKRDALADPFNPSASKAADPVVPNFRDGEPVDDVNEVGDFRSFTVRRTKAKVRLRWDRTHEKWFAI